MQMEMKTKLVDLGNGVYAFDQEMVRCFLIVGNRHALLFDSGAAPCDLPGMIRSITQLPLWVVQSHGDGDHTANSAQFPEIYAHPAEFPLLEGGRNPWRSTLLPVTEGDQFALGDRTLEVIEAPGHTPGSICLLDRENRCLFAGDTLGYGPVFLFGDHRDVPAYRRTLDKLHELQDFETVYPCHNTCPVSRDVIPELMAAVDGALDGSIPPAPSGDMPLPPGGGPAPQVYSSGRCGILYIR